MRYVMTIHRTIPINHKSKYSVLKYSRRDDSSAVSYLSC